MTVWITELASKGTVVIRWKELDGRTCQETVGRLTGAKRKDAALMREAQKRAKEIEEELAEDAVLAASPAVVSWNEFRKSYESEYLARKSKSHRKVWKIAADHFEEAIRAIPGAMMDIQSIGVAELEKMRSSLHGRVARASVDTYVGTLRSGLNYAHKTGLRSAALPPDPTGKSKPKMRGRPLTQEEFERMLAAVPKVITEREHVAAWREWLRGLYLSGLRISESLELSWSDGSKHTPLLERIPKIRFSPDQKNRTCQVVAIAPDFAAFLRARKEKTGYVFNPRTSSGRLRSLSHASRRISEIGEAARVSTEPDRWASAHDLRRSFGCRWSLRVMPPVLQHMMRHRSITTTMQFYVNHTADLLGREIAEAYQSVPPLTSEMAGEAMAKAEETGIEPATP